MPRNNGSNTKTSQFKQSKKQDGEKCIYAGKGCEDSSLRYSGVQVKVFVGGGMYPPSVSVENQMRARACACSDRAGPAPAQMTGSGDLEKETTPAERTKLMISREGWAASPQRRSNYGGCYHACQHKRLDGENHTLGFLAFVSSHEATTCEEHGAGRASRHLCHCGEASLPKLGEHTRLRRVQTPTRCWGHKKRAVW